ncbi:MAG: hypothetical protein EAZ85_03470 [Bacteroidetes bacterium]|nr:MAG: hypothetical protein EAZ85_03470 [Bacteroidota bacterium]
MHSVPLLFFESIRKKRIIKDKDNLETLFNELRDKIDFFLSKKDILLNDFCTKNLDFIFKLRVQVLEWLVLNGIDFDEKEFTNTLSNTNNDNSSHKILKENIFFAIRVSSKIFKNIDESSFYFPRFDTEIKNLSYSSVLFAFDMNVMDKTILNNIKGFFNSSLSLELGMIMGYFVMNNQFSNITIDKSNELARFIANNSHNFSAFAKMLNPSKKLEKINDVVAATKEHQELAELGINDYAQNLIKYDL